LLPALSVATGLKGNVPGPETALVALAKIVGVARLGVAATDTAAAQRLSSFLGKIFDKVLPLQEDAQEFRTQLKKMTEEETMLKAGGGSGRGEAREACQTILKRRFEKLHIGNRLNGVLFLLDIAQVVAIFMNIKSDPSRETAMNYAKLGLSGVGTLMTGATVLARIGAKVVDARIVKVSTLFLKEVADRASRVLSFFGGILAFLEGGATLDEGMRSGDAVKVVVGGMEMVSGVLLFVGSFCRTFVTASWLGPAGVLIGLLSTAIALVEAASEAARPRVVQYVEAIWKTLQKQATDTGVVRIVGMDEEVKALEAGFIHARVIYSSCGEIRPYSGRTYEELVAAVRALGFSETRAKECVAP
jgi:hypothetical protein